MSSGLSNAPSQERPRRFLGPHIPEYSVTHNNRILHDNQARKEENFTGSILSPTVDCYCDDARMLTVANLPV